LKQTQQELNDFLIELEKDYNLALQFDEEEMAKDIKEMIDQTKITLKIIEQMIKANDKEASFVSKMKRLIKS
jgi:alkyl hydroperoxide reductase subunit AhpF